MLCKASFKKALILTLALGVLALFSACNPHEYAESDKIIIDAKDIGAYIDNPEAIIIDMQKPEDYATAHVNGAVNVKVSDICINVPVDNMLAPKAKVEKTLGAVGVSGTETLVIYDSGSINSGRLWWTLKVYGYDNVKVVSGGIEALKAENIPMTSEAPQVTPSTLTLKDKDTQYIATMSDVQNQVNEPNKNVVLLDVRRDDEYIEVGKIPSSVMMTHTLNFYNDGTFKDTQATRLNYLDKEIAPSNEIIVYCKTSFRAAPVFLRLYDAGYRNLKIYDGAYLEWSGNSSNPVEMPEGGKIQASNKDGS